MNVPVLEWNKCPVDGDFAKRLRREIRMHRRERGRSGNRFSYSDLRALWSSGEDHAILTHTDNNLWQYWWNNPEKGWFLQSWHRLLGDAKEEAERPRPVDLAPSEITSGLYVRAFWPDSDEKPMMVKCSSPNTASQIKEIFETIGCVAEMKDLVLQGM